MPVAASRRDMVEPAPRARISAGTRASKGSQPRPASAPTAVRSSPLHAAGNLAVQRRLRGVMRQRMPLVGPPGDRYEQEAERLAAAIVAAPSHALACACDGLARPGGGCGPCRGESLGGGPGLRRLAAGPSGPPPTAGPAVAALRAPETPLPASERTVGRTRSGPATPESSADGHSPAHMITGVVWRPGVQRCGTGSSCNCHPGPEGDIHEQEADRTAERIGSQPAHQERVSRYGQLPGSPTALPAGHPTSASGLVGQLGPGRPLPERDRAHFEARLGADLGDVQLHIGDASHRAAESLHANAFTLGSHVGFRAGRFAPGTAEGQRLLAHELTHVLQQRRGEGGTGAGASVQRQPAPGEAAGGGPTPGPPPLTGEQVQFGGITLSQNPAQLRYAMEQLIINGRPMPMGNSLPPGLGSLQSFRFDLNRFTFAQKSEEWVCQEQPADDWQCRLALKIRPILDPILDDLERECQAEIERFQTAARQNTVRTLEANEQQARAELVRYGITEKQVQDYMVDPMSGWVSEYTKTEYRMGGATPAVKGLQGAAMVLLNRRQAIAEKRQEQTRHLYSGISTPARFGLGLVLSPIATMPAPDERYFELGREINTMEKDYNELQDTLGAQYPALAAVSELEQSPEGIRTLAAGTAPEMAALIGARVGSTLADIAKVRRGLWDDVNVWQLQPIMDLTKVELGIQPGTIPAALVEEKIRIEKPGILQELALAVLNIAALLLAAPTGGVSLAVMGAVNIGMAAVHVEEYLMATALHGSSLDQARALSQEDPSLFWLAVEIVGVGVGDVPAVASAGFRAFRVLAPVARAAVIAEEGKEAATALANLRLTAEEVQDAALAERLVKRVGALRGGRTTAMAAVGVTEEEARLLGATARAVETQAGQTIGHAAAAAGEGSVKLSRAGWLFDCTSPCTIIREKFAHVLGRDPTRLAELVELERRAQEAATTLEAARAVNPTSEAARQAERAANAVSEDAAAFVRRLHEAYPQTRPSLTVAANVADARAAFASALARRPVLSQELAELEKTLGSATKIDPAVASKIDNLQVRLAQLQEIDKVSQAPHNAQILEVSVDKAAANYFENIADTVPGPPVVLEFPDGSRVWRETVGGPIRHEATLGESVGRAGMERAKYTATQHGNLPAGPKYERAHSLGQGTGFESPYAIYYAPEYVNQTLQNRGIETYLRDLAASAAQGETFRVVTKTTAHPLTLRLATMDYSIVRVAGGKAEEVATYSLQVTSSAKHPRVTAGALRFSPTEAGQALAGRVPVPDVLSKPASFAY
jgi:Domain of unknown function (DUF4157)/Bacterial toxin 4